MTCPETMETLSTDLARSGIVGSFRKIQELIKKKSEAENHLRLNEVSNALYRGKKSIHMYLSDCGFCKGDSDQQQARLNVKLRAFYSSLVHVTSANLNGYLLNNGACNDGDPLPLCPLFLHQTLYFSLLAF